MAKNKVAPFFPDMVYMNSCCKITRHSVNMKLADNWPIHTGPIIHVMENSVMS